MSCQAYEDAILDGLAARPGDFDAHLASCSSCGALSSAHRSALGLQGVTPPLVRAPSRQAVMLRLGAVTSVLLVAVTMTLIQCRPAPLPTDVSLSALQSLTAQSERDLTVEDETYESFKQLPQWIAPQGDEP
jgi:hypothetical protein